MSSPRHGNAAAAPGAWRALLQREWMQHKVGWTTVVALPLVIGLVIAIFGRVQLDGERIDVSIDPDNTLALVMMIVIASGIVALACACAAALLLAPGLARRDRSDRSIEFWLSLPVSHAQAIAAPLLAHWLLVPLVAIATGLLSGQVIALAVAARLSGIGSWLALPWGSIALAMIALMLRGALGLVLALLWLAPLLGLVMAASAWLGRWGSVAVLGGLTIAAELLKRWSGYDAVWAWLVKIGYGAWRSFLNGVLGDGRPVRDDADALEAVRALPGLLASDAGAALRAAADPVLLGGLVLAAACFWLLVLRRQRGA